MASAVTVTLPAESIGNEPGAISSLKLPTAENATMAWTPMLLSAEMFARALTSDGGIEWSTPCREMNATSGPGESGDEASGGSVKMDRGEEGAPQG